MRLGFKTYILIYLGAIFLMSHIISNNVGAVTPTINLENYDMVYVNEEPAFNCNYSDDTWVRGTRVCDLDDNHTVMRTISTATTFAHKVGDIVNFDLVIYQQNINSLTQGLVFRTYYPGNNNVLLGFEKLSDTSMGHYINGPSTIYAPTGYIVSDVFNVTYASLNEANKAMGFATGTGNFIQYQANQYQQSGTQITTGLKVRIQNLKVYRYAGSAENAEQAQATQDAADNSETVAGDNSDNEATTNLIGAFGGFVTALGNLQATNCNVTLAWPSSLGGNMNVNICQNKNYAGDIVSIFGSLTMIVFYIPLALKLLSMIYNEIRSFTNG